MALSQRQTVSTDQEDELLYFEVATRAAGKPSGISRVVHVGNVGTNRRELFRRPWRAGRVIPGSITPPVNPPIRTARLGAVAPTGSGGEL